MAFNSNSRSNFINRNYTSLKNANKFVLFFIGLFVLLIIGLVIYWIYKAIQKSREGDAENPILVGGSIDASDIDNVKSWILPTSSGSKSPTMTFTISFWIYIVDWSYRIGEQKAILIKGTENGNNIGGNECAPGIWLDRTKNNLIIGTSIIGKQTQQCDVANIPIQKWVHIAYVLDNRTVDGYVDCKLERSCILAGVPQLNNKKLNLFPASPKSSDKNTGFFGQLSSFNHRWSN